MEIHLTACKIITHKFAKNQQHNINSAGQIIFYILSQQEIA